MKLNVKKIIIMPLLLCLVCVVAASYANKEVLQGGGNTPGAEKIADAGTGADTQKKSASGKAADVDLTIMSATMVYAEVYNIMKNPGGYIGKSIKISGQYYSMYYDKTDRHYHFVLIEDAAACCRQGLEFIWNGEHSYPGDYPKDKTNVEVTGVFGRYDELGETYYYLAVDDIIFKE